MLGFVLFFIVVLYFLGPVMRPKHPLELNVYFGVPGSGKTTYAAYLARSCARESIFIKLCRRFPSRLSSAILDGKLFKRAFPVWSNVPIKGTYDIDAVNDIGTYMIEDGKLIIDEAGIEYNNRNYKALPQKTIKWYKLHRHYGMSVDIFSQSFEDMDVTLRRLAQRFFLVKKSMLPYFVVIKRISRKIGIDENTHQLTDMYRFGLPILGSKWIFCPKLWRMFDSYDRPDLPVKDWKRYGERPPEEPTPEN